MLYAYFDETGTHSGSAVTAISGFVGSKISWEIIEERWSEVLSEFADKGVKTFHMTDCLSQRGEFALIDNPSCNYIITQLSRALGTQELGSLSSAVITEDWDNAVKDEKFLDRFPAPFFLCFDDIVRQLWLWSRKFANGERIAPMFAFNPNYHERMAAFGRAYSAESWYGQILGPIAFGRPSEVIPLQAADLLVNQTGGEIERRRYGNLGLAMGVRTVAANRATGGRYVHGHWFDANGLKLTTDRFREEGEIYSLSP